jgi:lysozyme
MNATAVLSILPRGLAAIGLMGALLASAPAGAVICPSGPEVDTEAQCAYFKFYRAEDETPDPRIAKRLTPLGNETVRSIALIIGNSVYPNIQGDNGSLPAAAIDVTNLTDFFVNDQHFDEVIVLSNGDATKDSIDYFLRTYLRNVGVEHVGKMRLVVAYSGHGVKATPGSDARLLLSQATSMADNTNSIPMADLRTRLGELSQNYFHVVALINACYSGALFGDAQAGGSLWDTNEPAAHAVSASSDIEPSFSLGGPTDGSIFFDGILAAIRDSNSDPNMDVVMQDNVVVQHGGVVRLGAVEHALINRIDGINQTRNVAAGDKLVKYPWIGSIVPVHSGLKPGGFFFLSPIIRDVPGEQVELRYVASFVPGQPELQVFGASEEYDIRGIDVSHYEGDIDWRTVRDKTNFRFAYLRFADSKGPDSSFEKHWQEAKEVGMDRGAVLVFDYCKPVDTQFAMIRKRFSLFWGELPFAIDVGQDVYPAQAACHDRLGTEGWQAAILDLAARLREWSGKTPLVYGTRDQFDRLLDDRFNDYMLWLAVYRRGVKPTASDLGLKGRNPWTLWQYDSTLTVPGIGPNVDGNVFWGNERAYQAFKGARSNLTLQMATQGMDL